MGRGTSNGNEVKREMKHRSDMPTPRFEICGQLTKLPLSAQEDTHLVTFCGYFLNIECVLKQLSLVINTDSIPL